MFLPGACGLPLHSYRKKVHSPSLMQHHVNLFACTLRHPPQGPESPTRRGQRVPGLHSASSKAQLPSWHKVTSLPDQGSLSRLVRQQAKEQETPKGRRNHSTHPLPSVSCCSSLLPAVTALPPRSSSRHTQRWCTRALWSGRCYKNGPNNSNPPPTQPTLKESVKRSPSQPWSIRWVFTLQHRDGQTPSS